MGSQLKRASNRGGRKVRANKVSMDLTEQQLEAIDLLTTRQTPRLKKQDIADKIGVSARTLQRWQRNPAFEAAYKREIVSKTTGRLPAVFDALIDSIIEDRNASAARLVLQANGMLGPERVTVLRGTAKTIDQAALKQRLDSVKGQS